MQAQQKLYGTEHPLMVGNVAMQETPQGYYTSEEFWQLVSKDIDNICRKYGIL
ncbi:hypothetical protein FACS189452_06010 [Bacteroidia bacterium]|nr:hypothetical protein FACS189452_06010 [Bacteroidia bacterium]GHT82504.1 hypothetical protein FACS189467_7780 [Bacteroidia bacterium]